MNTTVSAGVLEFLSELKTNNNRDWFNEHKERFKKIEAQVKNVYVQLWEQLKKHDEIDDMKLFRIYRDIRFSNDKTPYKTHFGGSFHRKKPTLRGGYYLHITPGESFVAVGFWEPNAEDLLRIRKELERDASELRAILSKPAFKKIWGALKGEELKTAPQGFPKDHPNLDLIRKKQHILIKNFTDEQVTAPDFLEEVNSAFKSVRSYLDYMSEVLTTDLNGISVIENNKL